MLFWVSESGNAKRRCSQTKRSFVDRSYNKMSNKSVVNFLAVHLKDSYSATAHWRFWCFINRAEHSVSNTWGVDVLDWVMWAEPNGGELRGTFGLLTLICSVCSALAAGLVLKFQNQHQSMSAFLLNVSILMMYLDC